MNGGKNRHLPAYTIVEVLIVLAVSGVMFLIAINFINGKQEKTAFSTGVNQIASSIQDVIEQVTDGQYSDIPFKCTSGLPPTFSSAAVSQGTNSPCIFVGKLFYFEQGTNPDYYIFSLAGNRLNASSQPAVTIADVQPTPVYGGGTDLTTHGVTAQNLQISYIHVDGSPAYDFGFTQGFGSLDASDASKNTYQSGTQTVSLITTPALSSAGLPYPGMITADLAPNAGSYTYATKVSMCVTDGRQNAVVDVGDSNGNQLAVNVSIKGTSPCP